MTRVYIAGKITGTPDYRERFAEAEALLKIQGHTVINPAAINDYREGATYREYIQLGLELLLTCNVIYLLKGWKDSKGALAEKAVADAVGICAVEEDWRDSER